jgi:hypothetical protein
MNNPGSAPDRITGIMPVRRGSQAVASHCRERVLCAPRLDRRAYVGPSGPSDDQMGPSARFCGV